ncbi:MAG: carbohydrate porin [Terracidiphilus sp.]|jgi:high affinity Mn2+ porin
MKKMKTMRNLLICLAYCLCCGLLFAQTAAPAAQLVASTDAAAISTEATGVAALNDFKSSPEVEGATQSRSWTWHVQSTAIEQMNAPFSAKYSGPNSLPTSVEGRETLSLDIYTGVRLWRGAELRVDMMTWQGFGLDTTLGIDDFPNGEAYKAGTRPPHENIARFFIRQTIGLGGERENIADDQLDLPGSQNVSRLTFTLGRFSCKDIFDTNSYANDPRTQFMNWALVANVGWDYPADSLGYTTGMAVELNHPKWALRYGFFQLPNQRNGFTADGQFLMWPGDSSAGDVRFFHDWGMVVEHERRYSTHAHPGAVRLLGYVNQANMGSYQAALSAPGTNIDLTHATRHTSGVGLNIEQEITKNIGVFSRLGWNDGHNEAWMFTDVNHTGSMGVSIKGGSWHRPDDTIGVAGVVSGISKINQEFLAAGGTGILDGDGRLQYAKEKVLETYYDCKLTKHLRGALDYQFVADPAFNSNRGPVSVFATRLHFEY